MGRALRNFLFVITALPLGGLLVLQGIILYRGSLPVPERALARAADQLAEHGWTFAFDELDVSLPAKITVRNLRLIPDGEEAAVVSAESGQIKLSFSALREGRIEVREITLYGGAVYCPPSLSPTGMAEPILEKAHVRLTPGKKQWRIQTLQGKFHNVEFLATGAFALPAKRDEDPVDWKPLLAELLPALIREKELFELVENPRVQVHLEPLHPAGLSVQVEGWADSVETPQSARDLLAVAADSDWAAERFSPAEIRNLTLPRASGLEFTASASYDGNRWTGNNASVKIREARFDSLLTLHNTKLELQWDADGEPALIPQRAHLFLAQAATPVGPLESFSVLASLEENHATAEFSIFHDNLPLLGHGHVDWAGTGRVELTSRVNPTAALASDFATALGLKREIAFAEAPFAKAEAVFEGWRFVQASGYALAQDANIDGVAMDWATARARLLPGQFVVPEMLLAYDDFMAEGRYEIDFATKAYRLFFKGSVRPLHIETWFRDWWTNLWDEFSFPQQPLRGDVDIRGVMGRSTEVKLFGSLGAENFTLRGVPFQSVASKLVVDGRYADFFDMRLVREEGMAIGEFQYWGNEETGDLDRITFRGQSTLDPVEVAQVFGDGGREIVAAFRFTDPPFLSAHGVFYDEPRENETRIHLTGEASAPLEFRSLPLNRLQVEAEINGRDWRLSDLSAMAAGGEITGRIDKWQEKDAERLGFTLFMRGLNLRRTLDAVSEWQVEAGFEEGSSELRTLDGILDLYVDATGEYGDLKSFTGEGSIQIQEADLAQIHLLGILSRILSVTPLGFTSLQFSDADAQFELDLNRLHFRNLVLSGPTSAIRAIGDYDIDEDALDFALRVYLLKETKIPLLSLLLSPLLEPLAHVMEIRMYGPVADPQWRFLLGPRNILRSISGAEFSEAPEE